MGKTPQYNIGPSGYCCFCEFIFIMSCFVFKQVFYDVKGKKKIPKSVKVCICFATVALPTNICCPDILKWCLNPLAVVFLGQHGLLAEVRRVSALCPEVFICLHVTQHIHQSSDEENFIKRRQM